VPIPEIPSTTKTYKLVQAWIEAKNQEDKAKDTRLSIEEKLFTALESDIPDKGSIRIEGIKITTGYNDNWDQEALQTIRKTWPPSFPPFPFKEELKADGKAITYLRKSMPAAYGRIEPALEQKAKKPSFSTDDEK
jgi:hypothetical protein